MGAYIENAVHRMRELVTNACDTGVLPISGSGELRRFWIESNIVQTGATTTLPQTIIIGAKGERYDCRCGGAETVGCPVVTRGNHVYCERDICTQEFIGENMFVTRSGLKIPVRALSRMINQIADTESRQQNLLNALGAVSCVMFDPNNRAEPSLLFL